MKYGLRSTSISSCLLAVYSFQCLVFLSTRPSRIEMRVPAMVVVFHGWAQSRAHCPQGLEVLEPGLSSLSGPPTTFANSAFLCKYSHRHWGKTRWQRPKASVYKPQAVTYTVAYLRLEKHSPDHILGLGRGGGGSDRSCLGICFSASRG